MRSAVAQLGERFYAQLPPGRAAHSRAPRPGPPRGRRRGGPTGPPAPVLRRGGPRDRRRGSVGRGRLGCGAPRDPLRRRTSRWRTRRCSASGHVCRPWLEDDEAGERLRRQLAPHGARVGRRAAGRGPSSTEVIAWRSALEWLAEHPDDLTTLETEFLRASKEEADKEVADRRRSVRRLQALASTLAVALVLAAVLGGVAVSERNEARSSAEAAGAAELDADVRALRAQALAEPRSDLALLLAAQAYRTGADRSVAVDDARGRTAKPASSLATHRCRTSSCSTLRLSADGDTVAAVGDQGGVYAWSSDDRRAGRDRAAASPTSAGPRSISVRTGVSSSWWGIPVAGGPRGPRHQGAGHRSSISPPDDRPARTLPGPALVGRTVRHRRPDPRPARSGRAGPAGRRLHR